MLHNKNFSVFCLNAVILATSSNAIFTKNFSTSQTQSSSSILEWQTPKSGIEMLAPTCPGLKTPMNKDKAGQGLTQLESTTNEARTCISAIDRNKQELVDFYSLLSQPSPFSDSDFRDDRESLYWKDFNEASASMQESYFTVEWQRANTAIPGAKFWGTSGSLSRDDINQGYIGNCWFLAGASAIAEIPGRLEKVFLNHSNDLNDAGIYGVNFYTLGVPHTVIVDDFLPLVPWGDGYDTWFAHIGTDNAMWMPILEKAFAKYHGNYQHIVGGNPMISTRTLSGAPFESYNHAYDDKNELWTTMMSHNDDDELIMAGTPGTSDSQNNSENLVQNHAYVVQHVQETSNGLKMVRLRNPWGKDSYTGKYSDTVQGAQDWTDEMRTELGHSGADYHDGVIWMEFDYYFENIFATYFNKDTTGWHTSSYLKLNDNSLQSDPVQYAGNYPWCGETCTRHKLNLKSTVDQEVYLTAYTWDDRQQPRECINWNMDKNHSIKVPHDQYVRTFRYGDYQLDKFTMTAGQSMEVIVEFNFADSEDYFIPKDWSLVAWAESGAVEIANQDGSTTDSLPFIERTVAADSEEIETSSEVQEEVIEEVVEEEVVVNPEVIEELAEEKSDFIKWAEEYDPSPSADSCGAGHLVDFDIVDGVAQYKAVMRNSCYVIGWNLEYTFIMDTQELPGLVKYESNGKQTVFDSCEIDTLNATDSRCKITVGKITDWESRGLQQELNDVVGWQNRPGEWGVKQFAYEWVQQ